MTRGAPRSWGTLRSRVMARRLATVALSLLSLAAAALDARPSAASSSADELVRQAHAHEAAHEDDVALRRYTDALAVDRTSADAWMGLGSLRLKLGEPEEAERVYDTALAEVPTLRAALEGRAHARWSLGRHAEAEADLESYAGREGDVRAFRQLADWFGADGRTPAQLATWRRLLVLARSDDDASFEKEARRMVRALVILVDGADPAASPVDPDGTRRALARIAARGG
jgi:tetratricopeptide (TPR) repeat protein